MTNTAENQAAAQAAGIRNMLAAVAVDYDRLEELRDEYDALEDPRDWSDAAEYDELREAAGDCASEDEARDRIQEDPLSVQVRSGWYSPGETDQQPEEFEILLCTGGPAVRIMGDLNSFGQPTRAYLQYQDWGTPWTNYYEPGLGDTLVEYASHFYFGE